MAVVYKAMDTLLSRWVAVKILREQYVSDEVFLERFRREAQAGARLSHPNIVSIYDVGCSGAEHFLVMEYVEGRTLKEIIKDKGALEEREVLSIGIQLCEAMEHAHENGLIHRDIKPHNILVTEKGRVKVTDFGIARACTSETVTFTGSMVGSVHYFSPEQAKGGAADVKSDIYSASVALFEAATGQLPFSADTAVSVALKHINEDPTKPRTVNPKISAALEEIILQGMRKDPAQRFSSAREMRDRLLELNGRDDFNNGPKTASVGSAKRKLRPAGWAIMLLALFMVAMGGYYGALGFFNVEEVQVPDVTNMSLQDAADALGEVDLRAEVNSERSHPQVPKGHVISQDPKAGSTVKKTREVKLEISLGPQLAEVPNVVGQHVREAEIRLSNAGFNVPQEPEYVFDNEVSEDIVIKQVPKAHSMQPRGEKISLVVSKGPEPEYIKMPDLVGMSLGEAEEELNQARLELGAVTHEQSEEYFSGQVINQDVKPGSSILQGHTVNIIISRGPGPPPQLASVTVPIPNDGKKHRVRIEVVDVRGTHEEYNDLHNPGDTVRTKVPFYVRGAVKIFRDGEKVYEQPVP